MNPEIKIILTIIAVLFVLLICCIIWRYVVGKQRFKGNIFIPKILGGDWEIRGFLEPVVSFYLANDLQAILHVNGNEHHTPRQGHIHAIPSEYFVPDNPASPNKYVYTIPKGTEILKAHVNTDHGGEQYYAVFTRDNITIIMALGQKDTIKVGLNECRINTIGCISNSTLDTHMKTIARTIIRMANIYPYLKLTFPDLTDSAILRYAYIGCCKTYMSDDDLPGDCIKNIEEMLRSPLDVIWSKDDFVHNDGSKTLEVLTHDALDHKQTIQYNPKYKYTVYDAEANRGQYSAPPMSYMSPPTSYMSPPTSYMSPPMSYTSYMSPYTSYMSYPTLPYTSYMSPYTSYMSYPTLPYTSYMSYPTLPTPPLTTTPATPSPTLPTPPLTTTPATPSPAKQP